MQPSPIDVTESPWVPSARRASFSIDCSSRSCERAKYGPVLARRPQRHVQTAGGRTILPHNLGPTQLQEEASSLLRQPFRPMPARFRNLASASVLPKGNGARHGFFVALPPTAPARTGKKRHLRKYAKGKLGPDRSLYAQNLNRSLPLAAGVGEDAPDACRAFLPLVPAR